MTRISQWAVRHPIMGLVSWFAIIGILLVLLSQFKGDFNDDFGLPASESTTAQDLLKDISGGGAGTGSGLDGQVVWGTDSGKATQGAAAQQVGTALKEISTMPGVACVISPIAAPLGPDCLPQQAPAAASQEQAAALANMPAQALGPMAHFGQAGVSPDGTIAYATVRFTGAGISDLPTEQIANTLKVVKAVNGEDGLTVGANGVFTFVQGDPPSSEGIGILVALTILLFAFASILGAFLPVWTAAISVGVSTAIVVPIIANFFSVAAFAPFLSSMIGLGVGIDYSLFIINRYREALIHGREPREAALESVRTSGRAVIFAALTVIIALLGLFIMGISFFNGVALAAAGTVVMVALGALLLLPSLLALLGTWSFVGRMAWVTNAEAIPRQKAQGILHGISLVLRWIGWVFVLPVTIIGWLWRRLVRRGHAPDAHNPSAFARYGEWLQNHPWPMALGALVIMILIAVPVTQLRQGFPDDSGAPQGSVARIAYDLTAEGFGPGVNGPMFIAVKLPSEGGQAAMGSLATALNADPGVALAVAAPAAPDAEVGVVQVFPKTAPQDAATTHLLFHLRDSVIPQSLDGTGATAYVGGFQAVTADFTKVLTDALPLFLLIVVSLGFIALLFLFRSILVPLMGVLFSLLSLGAALGVTVAVFQWGWLAGPLGLQNTGPIFPFLPIMVFAILFGLSCDYQVFLVSRMHEEWVHGKDHHRAIRRGLAGSGRVVAIAALIMTSVFAAFALGNDPTTKLFAVALSSAVLLDAFVVRLVLVPALMSVIGPRTWWLPRWLDKILPHFSVDSEADSGADEIADIEESAVRA
ncbi:MAG: MMPL family transporter [Actinomycetota bacterium]|nr:MMPL family transporter [Actinomycetota bacterium]